MRKVRVFKSVRNERRTDSNGEPFYVKAESHNGLFHGFHSIIRNDDNCLYGETVALIEDEQGFVSECEIDMIKFIK